MRPSCRLTEEMFEYNMNFEIDMFQTTAKGFVAARIQGDQNVAIAVTTTTTFQRGCCPTSTSPSLVGGRARRLPKMSPDSQMLPTTSYRSSDAGAGARCVALKLRIGW